ncbi:hypothetical protein ASPBRDRAFT_561771 [Aspergillus brasiliensis CBS 101740]|uniref:Uncharacterized protein n=1 Tax=Aspergillus brasiliensis (strain CBS 101740 / IMI 381727 / IBT 21946) TaxID=767769 RepID=A0A1L9UMR3_ASPBC|nr:hypothetical protein ASPBRDRAFT_561771 [Aspergillus brasiliensis CBS 101740]
MEALSHCVRPAGPLGRGHQPEDVSFICLLALASIHTLPVAYPIDHTTKEKSKGRFRGRFREQHCPCKIVGKTPLQDGECRLCHTWWPDDEVVTPIQFSDISSLPIDTIIHPPTYCTESADRIL